VLVGTTHVPEMNQVEVGPLKVHHCIDVNIHGWQAAPLAYQCCDQCYKKVKVQLTIAASSNAVCDVIDGKFCRCPRRRWRWVGQ
jgi:hypothetical protein